MRITGVLAGAFLLAQYLADDPSDQEKDKTPIDEPKSFLLHETFGGHFCDAEKSRMNKDDDWLCWAAAAANVLAWTGWGKEAGFANEDTLFEYFQKHWSDDGRGSPRRAWYWFFKGSDYGADGAEIEISGGGFFPNEDLGDQTWINEPQALYRGIGSGMIRRRPLALKQVLDDGYGVSIQIVKPLESGKRKSHVVSLWGYTHDNTQPFRGVYITDSDDDKKGRSGRKAKNRLRHYAVTLKDGIWWFDETSDYEGWHILAAYALKHVPESGS